jgi:hypothetical protein
MTDPLLPVRPGVVGVQTTPRPTPTPIRVKFSDVLSASARTLVQGAQAAMQILPGAPLVALALRGESSGVPSMGVMSATVASPVRSGISSAGTSPEGPTTSAAGTSATGTAAGLLGAGSTTGDGSVEGALAQQEQMSMYYLQVQEEVNAQNRTFSALSNVLEVEHNTAKTAIGNIH